MNFCTVELGSFYLDVIKDRQYTANTNSIARRSCQTALYHIAEAMVRWIAPIMSFTAQEIWQELPGTRDDFVFTGVWYAGFSGLTGGKFDDNFWQQLLQVRDEVNKVLEAARREEKIGASLQAEVTLYASAALASDLAKLGDELRFVLITSTAQVSTDAAPTDAVATELPGLQVQVQASTAAKCSRCWHHRHDVGANAAHADLCLRCVTNVDGEGEQRVFA